MSGGHTTHQKAGRPTTDELPGHTEDQEHPSPELISKTRFVVGIVRSDDAFRYSG